MAGGRRVLEALLQVVVVLFFLRNAKAISCTGQDVYKGEPASVTCHFDSNLLNTNENFLIRHRAPDSKKSVVVLSCNWVGAANVSCSVGGGFAFNNKVTNTTTLAIHAANRSHVGWYHCDLVSRRAANLTGCNISLKLKAATAETAVETTLKVIGDATTTSRGTTGSSSDSPDNSDKGDVGGGSEGTIAAAVIIPVLLVLGLLVLAFWKRAWLKGKRQLPEEDEEKKATVDNSNGKPPPTDETQAMV